MDKPTGWTDKDDDDFMKYYQLNSRTDVGVDVILQEYLKMWEIKQNLARDGKTFGCN